MALRWVSWTFYLVGIALVLGGYLGIVSDQISWAGWVIGMIGWGLGFLDPARNAHTRELDRLTQLHRQGALTDEDFEAAKRKALDLPPGSSDPGNPP